MKFVLTLVLLFHNISCNDNFVNRNRPSEDDSEFSGYLEEQKQTVLSGASSIIETSITKIEIFPSTLKPDESIDVRMRVLQKTPDSSSRYGTPLSEIVQVELLSADTEQHINSNVLEEPFLVSQKIASSDPNISFVIVNNPSTIFEKIYEIKTDSINIKELGLGLVTRKFSFEALFTNAIIYAVDSIESNESIEVITKSTDITSPSSIKESEKTASTNARCSNLNGGSYIFVQGDQTEGLGGLEYETGSKPYGSPTDFSADFCIMKFEAKNVEQKPHSIANGLPWTNISYQEAIDSCENLGEHYFLVNNAQYQTVARSIEAAENENSNWLKSNIYDHDNKINTGYSTGSSPIEASPDDELGCFSTSTADNCENIWQIEKRTHTLTNGSVIWDFSGNVYEMIKGENFLGGSKGFIAQSVSNNGYELIIGPKFDHILKGTDSHGGLGYFSPSNESSRNILARGGAYNSGANAGIFSTGLFYPVSKNSLLGFRCVHLLLE